MTIYIGLEKSFCIHFLAQLPFTKSERELEYHYQKLNLRVASRVDGRLTTYHLRKLINFNEPHEMLRINCETLSAIQNSNFPSCVKNKTKKNKLQNNLENLFDLISSICLHLLCQILWENTFLFLTTVGPYRLELKTSADFSFFNFSFALKIGIWYFSRKHFCKL